MSSDNKKIFTTQAASKGAGADVTSDVIALPDSVSDAILSVKTDASCTGVVDVELEMSPDGTNWCPAVTRTVAANVVSVEPKIGNEEYVKLTPDVGEFKNKHARGGLNFDVNGAVVTPDGSGTRDLMDQHIAVNKSFNYSQWFKTSEAPTTTYKPVLFRHGGYDDFENIKVIQADGTSNTQNLCESKSSFQSTYNAINSGYGNSDILAVSGTPAETFYGASGYVTNGYENDIGKHLVGIWNPHEDFSTSRWLFQRSDGTVAGFRNRSYVKWGYPSQNYVQANTYVRFYGPLNFSPFVTYSNTAAAEKHLIVSPVMGGIVYGTTYWYVYDSNPLITFTRRSDNTTFTVNIREGYHAAITYTAPTDITQGIPEANVSLYINGERVKLLTTTENNVEYMYGAAPSDALFNGDEGFAVNSNWGGTQYLDYGTTYHGTSIVNNHMDFQGRVLTANEISTLYNNGKLLDFSNMQTSFPISISNCVGAYDSDVPYYYLDQGTVMNGFEDCSGYGKRVTMTATSSSGQQATQSTLTPAVGYMSERIPLLQSKFTTTSNLSISGWFKTTDTGTLFSNTEGAAASGMVCEVTATNIGISFKDGSPSPIVAIKDVDDGNWHHIVVTKNTSQEFKIYVDGVLYITSTATGLTDADLKGNNGFTLLSDGQNNAYAASPSSTDASKLNASLSNWSIHSEVLDEYAAKQLYSNGHVRNIKNLPSVTAGSIEAWWQLNDSTNPAQDTNDPVYGVDLQYQDGGSNTLVSQQVNADGATLVEDSINGNAMTLSLTKSFNFTTKEWVTTADQPTALCLSFNGFEEQAEHIALWKCTQTVGGQAIDICDGGWHNVILSYRGNNDLAGNNVAEGDVVKFGPGPAQNLPHNWMMSFDGEPLKAINDGSGADHIDGLGSTITDTYNSTVYNVGFNIYNRHMKYEASNTEEVYKPHAQFSAGIHEVTAVDNINAFQGSVDETSFHSDCWWVDQAGTSIITNTFNQEKPAALYGSTTALTNRGVNTAYPVGVPYPLTSPEEIGSARGGNQWINPYRKGEIQEDAATSIGGVEGWWRWGDTPGDCSVTINDVRDHADSINARDIAAFEIVTADRQDMSVNNESIYNEDIAGGAATGNVAITFPQIVVAGIQAGICNLKQISSPLLKYLRVKFTGAGSCDLGSSSTQAQINFRSKE